MTKFFRLSSLASFAGALAFALVHPLASPARAGEAFRGGPEAAHQLMACGGGGSGAYRKPQRPTAHNHASPATPSLYLQPKCVLQNSSALSSDSFTLMRITYEGYGTAGRQMKQLNR